MCKMAKTFYWLQKLYDINAILKCVLDCVPLQLTDKSNKWTCDRCKEKESKPKIFLSKDNFHNVEWFLSRARKRYQYISSKKPIVQKCNTDQVRNVSVSLCFILSVHLFHCLFLCKYLYCVWLLWILLD